jgi:glycosyltransferase involved in cell wall biosynthesis
MTTITDISDSTIRPFVSICTPTFNRRPFIPTIIKCVDNQDYPKDRMEWIIIDDGTDLIEDLVINHPQVKYYKYDTKMTLGKKRNLMHEKSCGDILVYMDDDDYYPSTRVSHAVNTLLQNPSALCAGASEIYIYYKHIHKMYQFGPYSKTHATAGTFAFKKELLKQTRYNDETSLSEEKEFLKDYTIPFVQLDPQHTILVFSHIHNTFDKRKLLEDTYKNPFTKISDKTIDYFMNEEDIKEFFMVDIDDLLDNYEPGRAEMKPDVLKQMEKIEVIRKEIIAKRRISGNEVKPQQKTSLVQEQQMKRLFELHRTKIHELSEQIKLKDTIIQEQEKQIALLRK